MHDDGHLKPQEGLGHDLALVMPVYNEAACIGAVVDAWREMLGRTGIDFLMIIVDDGSNDGTSRILQDLSDDDRIRVIRQANAGHGPAVLHGYRQAIQSAGWVFQCDSDDEMSPDSFPALWAMRHQCDAVFGYRLRRKQSLGRRLISWCSRATVRVLFGRGIKDVNTPYRLLRTSTLQPILEHIAPDAFAPNVIISGILALSGARIDHLPVPHQQRRTGSVSIVKWRLWSGALRSFLETLHCRRKMYPWQSDATEGIDRPGRTRRGNDRDEAIPERRV